MLAELKMYHWRTHSYARHKLADELHAGLAEAVDRFVEAAMGRYGRPNTVCPCVPALYSDAELPQRLARYAAFVAGDLSASLRLPADADLAALRDEMLERLTRARYVATLGGA